MRRVSHMLVVCAVLVGVLGIDLSVATASDSVSVEVRSIEAKKTAPKDGGAVGSELKGLESKLKGTFSDYKSFRQLTSSTFSLGVKESHTVALPNTDQAEFTYEGKAGELLKLAVNVADRASISLRVSSGSTFFQAGLDVDGGMLIVAVTVTEK